MSTLTGTPTSHGIKTFAIGDGADMVSNPGGMTEVLGQINSLLGSYPGALASASAVAVTPNATHLLTGTTAVNTMTGGTTGCHVRLIASGQSAGVCVVLNHATGANNLSLRDSANLGIYAGESVTFVFDGTKWVEAARNLKPVLDYQQITTPQNITATSEGTATTAVQGATVTYDGATPVRIEVFSPGITQGTTTIADCLYDASGGGAAASIGWLMHGSYAAVTDRRPYAAVRRLTPSAATHAYSWRLWVDAGTGVAHAGAGGSGNLPPAFLRITRDV